ncbi:PQQ-binding-like beta-propeller repeat protein [Candidatus Pelagibacter sp. Uisw_127]|uniref:outer membrane protein assembly factor BamB family protein n=1 Tax=Candidatus Pelagibacter sp. Uisw_127 TaxID=3230988 RepID=UPI0039EA7167
MNKLSLLILILLFVNNCSINKKKVFFGKDKPNLEKTQNIKTVLTKQVKEEQELNPTLEIKISDGKFNKNYNNNQNNIGELFYEGGLEKIGKYNFSKFDNFQHIDVQPVFYNENIIFSDNKGAIILYDQNQKIIWKKNFYSKREKKLKPRLNFAIHKNILIVTDNIAKYYALNIETGDMIWSKNNTVPFNSEIKIKDSFFYAVDYKNILRSISIKDGLESWNLKTEESLTKSNTKISIVIKNQNIYFNNSIGDITAVNLKSGQLVWQLPTQNNNISKNAFQLSSSRLVINEDSILFSNNKSEFYSIDITTGLINWKNEINSDLKPVVIGKLIITISEKGYLYIIDKKSGNIIRINDLFKNYKDKKRSQIKPTGFFVALNKIYLTNSDGKLIIVNSNDGNILNVVKISGGKILQPFISENNLFLISNGSIIKFN